MPTITILISFSHSIFPSEQFIPKMFGPISLDFPAQPIRCWQAKVSFMT